jgi:hypothetical protein
VKAKLWLILAVAVFVFSSVITVRAEIEASVWREEMTYQSLDQLETGGWTVTHEVGVSFSGDAIIIDGTSQDTSIHYSQFPSGISDWKVEDKSRWTIGSHCGNSVTAVTDKHSYAFMADGWYGNYVFYRDGQKTTFGSFQENKNEWFTLAIEKQGNQINMYYNGEVKSTYTETDTASSNLINVDAVSPWKGGSEYDYFEVWQIGDTSTQDAQESLLSNPIVIGGIIGAVGVGVVGVLYFFVFGGGGAAGSAAGSAGASGSSGGGSSGGGGSGSGGEENPMLHPTGGGTLIHPPSSLQNTLNEVAMNDTSGPPISMQNSTEMQSGETLYDAADKPNSINPQEHIQSEGSNPSNNSDLHTEANDTLTQLMNQSQQNVPDRLQLNSDTVTQQTQIPQESAVNVVATPGDNAQNVLQSLDKGLKPKTDAKTSTTDSG